MDLFGGEDSDQRCRVVRFTGLKGRYREGDGIYKDPKALDQFYKMPVPEGSQLTERGSATPPGDERPAARRLRRRLQAHRRSLAARPGEVRDRRHRDPPRPKFNRNQGVYGNSHFNPGG